MNSPRLSDGRCAIVRFGSFSVLMMVRYDLSARAAFVLRECLATCVATMRIMELCATGLVAAKDY